MQKAIIAIDQGTSSSRAVLFDTEFSIIHIEQENIDTLYPVNGWVEQDANEIWDKTLSVTKKIISYAKSKSIKVVERKIKPEELSNFVGCFLTGSAAEITPVASIDKYNFKVCNEIIGLSESYQGLVRRKKNAA
jgi:hypothetical protein